ncbi:MAG: toxin-antitoxin system, antitoxin component [Thermodesulfobacteriota bacterium]|nr:toxin-antitoxin system, antitoxin component [Thermodesulfobacteriota bacterium]
MPAQNPRINVVLNNLLYQDVRLLAEKDNVSLSAKVRDLIKEALEIQEDIVLSGFAEKREESWNDSKALSHDDVWS